MELTHVEHPFAPVFDETADVLILGSFPSVKSREQQFYYGHPQNRFWRMLAGVFGEETPQTVAEKKELLARNHVALWDVVASCDITGSADSSIRNVAPNDMQRILERAPIAAILANGDKAYRLFLQYCKRDGQPEVYRMPSTSPANAAWSLERLVRGWGERIGREGGSDEKN